MCRNCSQELERFFQDIFFLHNTSLSHIAPCLRLRRKCGRLSPWLIKVRPDTWPEFSIPTFATPGKAVWNWGSKFHTMLWFQFQFPVCRKDAAWRLPTNAAWAVSRSVAVAAAAAYKPYTIKSLCNWLHFFTAQASFSTADRYFFKTRFPNKSFSIFSANVDHQFNSQQNSFKISFIVLFFNFVKNRLHCPRSYKLITGTVWIDKYIKYK